MSHRLENVPQAGEFEKLGDLRQPVTGQELKVFAAPMASHSGNLYIFSH